MRISDWSADVCTSDLHTSVRALEGLASGVRLAAGRLPEQPTVTEGGGSFPLEPLGGQKTGWYFDHRDNRAFVARLAAGARVLDLYSHTGGFGIQCAVADAAQVDLVDRDAPALQITARAAELSRAADRVNTRKADALPVPELSLNPSETSDDLVCYPPLSP